MDGGENKRRAKRKDLPCALKVRFAGQDNYTNLAVKNVSALGLRVIVVRLIKAGDYLEIKLRINGRDIQCKCKVVWALLLSFCLGNLSSFDVGLEFHEISTEDREFLAKLTE
ncbi:MAG: PilZ domain-containing protein [Candidatus Omnitrophica bacterium]|nr:PilZ domain-containing protein [Candidatus Omnitrophota bacterium]MBU1922922.1 PilZ domain-containing protein [Candidatus Omnitrophota bacterium]